jgi:pilus assembly protein CpaC
MAILLALILSLLLMTSFSGTTSAQEAYFAKQLDLISGKSIVLSSSKAVKRVSIADPEVADFILLSPKELYITGKEAGTTNMTLWQNGKVVAVYDINVRYDITRLKQDMHELLPDEEEIHIVSSNDTITLSGRVSKAASLSQAVSIAKAYAPDEKVNNLIQVGGVHQVMLEVRVAEMSKGTAKELGVNFAWQNGDDFGVSLLSNLVDIATNSPAIGGGGGIGGYLLSPAVNSLFRFSSGNSTWTGFIDALKEDGLVKVLAEPTLIALSGQSASFLAGGEYPVPVPQGLGTVAIDYKPFGVGLTFTPTVLDEDRIGIEVAPEVSELDFSTAVNFSGFVIPGLSTRRASTVVELGDGQSFAVAGLLKETIRHDIAKVPWLGDIPVLGVLFQSKKFQKNETELVIIVTPHLVKPIDGDTQQLPTDFYIEPSEPEFYLGQMEGRHRAPASNTGGLDGEFGHSVPE